MQQLRVNLDKVEGLGFPVKHFLVCLVYLFKQIIKQQLRKQRDKIAKIYADKVGN